MCYFRGPLSQTEDLRRITARVDLENFCPLVDDDRAIVAEPAEGTRHGRADQRVADRCYLLSRSHKVAKCKVGPKHAGDRRQRRVYGGTPLNCPTCGSTTLVGTIHIVAAMPP